MTLDPRDSEIARLRAALAEANEALAGKAECGSDKRQPADLEVRGAVQGISDDKRAEIALKKNEAELRRVLAQLNEAQRLSKTGSSMSDLASDEHIWSDELYRICEFEPGSKVTTERYFDLVHPDDRAALNASIQSALSGATDTADLMIRFVTPSGLKHIHLVASRMTEFGGRPIFVGAIQDVTEATLAKEALQNALAQLTEGQRLSKTGSFTTDMADDRNWSDGAYRIFEFEPGSKVTPQRIRDVVHPEDLAKVSRTFERGTPNADFFFRIVTASGTLKHVRGISHALEKVGGRQSFVGALQDVTETKLVEEALKANEAELRRAYNSFADAQRLSHTGSFINDFGSDVWVVSDETYRIFEYELGSTITTQRIRDTVHPEDRESLDAALKRLDTPAEDFLFRIVTKSGALKYVRAISHLVEEVAGRPSLVGAVQDVTATRLAEEALRRSEAFLAHGEAVSETGSFLWKIDTDEIRWSKQLYRIFEFEPGSLVTLERIGERVHPQDVFTDPVHRAYAGLDSEYEHRLLMPDGTIKYLRFVGQFTRDPDGGLEYMGTVQDITRRKLAEQEHDRVRSELMHAARAMSLGVLTASLAHEINQPLASIITNAYTCLRTLDSDPPNVTGAVASAHRMIRDGNRASEVINGLRALFSKKEFATEMVDLSDATREVLALLAHELQRHQVAVSTEFADHPIHVVGDRVQLQQVILNLLLNARDAVKDVEAYPRAIVVRTGEDGAGSGRITVRDTGVGIAPEACDRIFDAFYTTKGDGMGIGLSISRSIVERHNGRLWAEPNEGPGTTFSFSIPLKIPLGDESH